MQYCDIKELPYCDLRMGVIFYFYDNPAKYKNEIKEMFDEYCNLTENEFLYYYKNEHTGFKYIKKDYKHFFHDLIDKSDFESSEYIFMTNAAKEQMQSVKAEMMMRNIHPEYPAKSANYMYFEFLPTIEYGEVLQFIKHAFWMIPYHYCCGNLLIAGNDQYIHKSRSRAVKLFRETKCLSEVYSVFMNLSLCSGLETKIFSSNFVQVLSSRLYNTVGLNTIIDVCEDNNIYHELGEDYIIISLAEDHYPAEDNDILEKYIILNNLFKDNLLEMKKPRLYWKSDEWDEWINRFN